jgi:hypothetical protein
VQAVTAIVHLEPGQLKTPGQTADRFAALDDRDISPAEAGELVGGTHARGSCPQDYYPAPVHQATYLSCHNI